MSSRVRVAATVTLSLSIAAMAAWFLPFSVRTTEPVSGFDKTVLLLYVSAAVLSGVVTAILFVRSKGRDGPDTAKAPTKVGVLGCGLTLMLLVSVVAVAQRDPTPLPPSQRCLDRWDEEWRSTWVVTKDEFLETCAGFGSEPSSGVSNSGVSRQEIDDMKAELCEDPRNRAFINDWDEECG